MLYFYFRRRPPQSSLYYFAPGLNTTAAVAIAIAIAFPSSCSSTVVQFSIRFSVSCHKKTLPLLEVEAVRVFVIQKKGGCCCCPRRSEKESLFSLSLSAPPLDGLLTDLLLCFSSSLSRPSVRDTQVESSSFFWAHLISDSREDRRGCC